MLSVAARQRVEIEFWRTSKEESPEADSVHNIVEKVSEAAVFLELLNRYREHIGGRVLELGAGQCWASCLVKRLFPLSYVTATDISPFAVQSANKWERIWQTKLDRVYACKAFETSEVDASIDTVFAYASAHHFIEHAATMREIARVLRPGGTALLLYEPASPAYLYRLARWRVNRKRPEVPEDVLVPCEMVRHANAAMLDIKVDYFPSTTRRGALETLYYWLLQRLQPLQRMLPCTVNLIIRHKR